MRLNCSLVKSTTPILLLGGAIAITAAVGGLALVAKTAAVALSIFLAYAAIYGLRRCLCKSVEVKINEAQIKKIEEIKDIKIVAENESKEEVQKKYFRKFRISNRNYSL